MLILLAVAFVLEWNATYRTDVPYEVEMSPAKIGADSFIVKADGKSLKTEMFTGKLPGTVDLRFVVPAGTKSLSCEGRKGGANLTDVARLDNLFSGAFDTANLGKWQLTKGVTAAPCEGGLAFACDESLGTCATAAYAIDLPEGMGGKPVMQDIEVTNLGKLVWGGKTYIEQYDADGKLLPETLADRRWTTHMRPPNKVCTYRDEGHIHPRARRLRFVAELNKLSSKYDDYGLPIKDPSILLPKLSLTRLAVRTAERLPFPKFRDGFFGTGVSGKPGDTSFAMGGENGRSMSYQVRSRAGWSQSYQFREESDIYFPSGAATVEAWIKPDWKTFAAHREAENEANPAPATIFEGMQDYIAAECKKGMGRMFALDYHPTEKRFTLLLRDWTGKLYEQDVRDIELKDGEWAHLAVQWTPGGSAELYVNGRKAASMPIPEFQSVPLADKSIKNVNDRWAMEFFFGASCRFARLPRGVPVGPGGVFFDGEGDNLRVSTGCRYKGDFTPAKEFALDGDTRALFTFDRWFDGVSGGGFGYIPASVRALDDRVDHELEVEVKGEGGQRKIQYFPKDILPENDPMKVLDHDNYPVMPSDAEYREARTWRRESFEVKPGEKVRIAASERAYPTYVEYENISKTEPLRYPILVRKGCLDPRSFGDLSDSLTLAGMSDRDRVNRLFQFVMRASDYFMNHQACFSPGSDAPHSACYEAMIMLNSYCGFECGPLNNMTANMLATVAKCPTGQTAGYGHEFEQVFYDGKNHIYDLAARRFFPAMDNETAAYLKEVGDQPIINRRVGHCADHFYRRGTRGSWVQSPSYQEKFGAVLNPGEKLRVWYANDAQMNNINTRGKGGVYGWKSIPVGMVDYAAMCGADDGKDWTVRRDRIFPHYSTSVISFDGRPSLDNPAFVACEGGTFAYHAVSPYPVVFAEYAAELKGGRKAALEVSTDFGKTFHALPAGRDGRTRLEYRVKARHDFLIRVKAPVVEVMRFTARTEGEVNPRTYPGWVIGGDNEFTFKAEPGGTAKVTVAWREPAKEIVVSGTAKQGAIPGFETELTVVDPAKPLTLDVSGASDGAKVRTHGRIKAVLFGGRLTLAYDPTKQPAIKRGDDNPGTRKEFPAFAAVDIVDGKAVKTVTAIIAPNARLLLTDDPVMIEGKRTFTFEKLPAGKYQVFALGRADSRSGGLLRFSIPGSKEDQCVWRAINEFFDYRGMVFFGREGERSRWKWDTAVRSDLQHSSSGFLLRTFDIPETKTLTFYVPWRQVKPFEFAAALVLPDPDEDSQLELRKMLFGLNCDPFHVE